MKGQILRGRAANEFASKAVLPLVKIEAGGQPLAFNEEMLATAGIMPVFETPNPRTGAGLLEYRRHQARLQWARRWLPILNNDAAFVANSILDKREWADLERAVIEAVHVRLNAVQDLQDLGLVDVLADIGVMFRQWRVGTEVTRPSVTMDGRTRTRRDRVDKLTFGVPIPIIASEYELGRRELLASRRNGAPIDTNEATEHTFSVVEEAERMLFRGEANMVVQGSAIFGYTNLAARQTLAATGDWGTITNIMTDVTAMVAALNAVQYFGPYYMYVSTNQYVEVTTQFFTDGSGQAVVDRILTVPQISAVRPSDFLPDGNVVLVQMTANVVQMAVAMAVSSAFWTSGDEQSEYHKIMWSGAPKLITDADGNAGIAHLTGA